MLKPSGLNPLRAALLLGVCLLVSSCISTTGGEDTAVYYVEFTAGVFPEAPDARAIEIVLNEREALGNKWVLQLGFDRTGNLVAAREISISSGKLSQSLLEVRTVDGEPHSIINGYAGGWELIREPGSDQSEYSYGVMPRPEGKGGGFWIVYPKGADHPAGWIATPMD